MGADTIPGLKPEGLPGVLAEIARITSVDVAVKIARHWNGERYMPRDPGRDHALSKLVGIKAARLIAKHVGAGHIRIPNARGVLRYHDARRLRRSGATLPEIGAILGITAEQAGRLCKGVVLDHGHATCGTGGGCPLCGHQDRRKGPAPPTPLPLFPWL